MPEVNTATTTEPEAQTNDAATADGADPGTDPGSNDSAEVDWKAKFEAQQKVTRDLERKVKGEAGTLREQIAELQAKIDGKEAEHQAAVEEQRIKDEALAAADERILRAEIRAAAAAKLADPADALRFLDLSDFEVGEGGEVDAAAVEAAIDQLITSKPYLAAEGGPRFGDAGQGARKESRPAQLSKSDVERLYAAGKHEEVAKARAEGRLADLLSQP